MLLYVSYNLKIKANSLAGWLSWLECLPIPQSLAVQFLVRTHTQAADSVLVAGLVWEATN